MDGRADGYLRPTLLGRLGRVDLKMETSSEFLASVITFTASSIDVVVFNFTA